MFRHNNIHSSAAYSLFIWQLIFFNNIAFILLFCYVVFLFFVCCCLHMSCQITTESVWKIVICSLNILMTLHWHCILLSQYSVYWAQYFQCSDIIIYAVQLLIQYSFGSWFFFNNIVFILLFCYVVFLFVVVDIWVVKLQQEVYNNINIHNILMIMLYFKFYSIL